ncbi:MAG: hypothetical protein Kow0075_08870 [Salibacteraceae bacterium]
MKRQIKLRLDKMKRTKLNLLIGATIVVTMTHCGGGETNSEVQAEPIEIYKPKAKASPYGVGPLQQEMALTAIDLELAAQGEEIFNQMCTACHKMDVRHVGPPLGEVVERRNPAWIMNMILNPENMVKEDPIAKDLLAEYLSPMANQNLTEEQARAVLEYFRKYNSENK